MVEASKDRDNNEKKLLHTTWNSTRKYIRLFVARTGKRTPASVWTDGSRAVRLTTS